MFGTNEIEEDSLFFTCWAVRPDWGKFRHLGTFFCLWVHFLIAQIHLKRFSKLDYFFVFEFPNFDQ
jgi:hypothetical protein